MLGCLLCRDSYYKLVCVCVCVYEQAERYFNGRKKRNTTDKYVYREGRVNEKQRGWDMYTRNTATDVVYRRVSTRSVVINLYHTLWLLFKNFLNFELTRIRKVTFFFRFKTIN